MLRRSLAGVAGVIVALSLAGAAHAATVSLGQVAPPGTFETCGDCSDLQRSTDPATPSYVVPPLPASGNPWTLTSWSVRGLPAGLGTARALVWRPSGTPGEFRLVANSADGQVTAGAIGTFQASISVQPGDVLGIRSGTNLAPLYDSAHPADVWLGAVGDPVIGDTTGAPGSTFPFVSDPNFLLNVSATITSPDPVVAPTKTSKKKCKKHKKKRSAETAKKKKCKKRKKH